MRKSISLLVCFSLLSCLSLNLYSQSAGEELDQVKLAQQFIGTWETSIGKDSVQQLITTPSGGGGLLGKIVYKSGGKVYAEGVYVTGYSPDRKTIIETIVWPNGLVAQDIGRFVTEKKFVVERFRPDSPNHAVAIFEYEFTSPNSLSAVWYGRGQNITWEPLGESRTTYTKID